MQSLLGQPLDTTLIVSNGDIEIYGARIEVPVTRAIATAWQPASIVGDFYRIVLESPVAAGDYQLVWMDNLGGNQVFVPLTVSTSAMVESDWPEVDLDAVRPTVEQVATLEHTRLMDEGGKTQETFTDGTEPTSEEVNELIDIAVNLVMVQLPLNKFNPDHYETVRHAGTLQAAILVEGSFFREKLDSGSAGLYTRMLQSTIISLNNKIVADARIGSGRSGGQTLVRIH